MADKMMNRRAAAAMPCEICSWVSIVVYGYHALEAVMLK
jgi:hypothetical protein